MHDVVENTPDAAEYGDEATVPRQINRWTAQFDDPETESLYRQNTLRDARRINLTGLGIFAGFMLLVAISDLALQGFRREILIMTALRAGMFLVLASAFVFTLRSRDPRRIDLATLATLILMSVFFASMAALRPLDQDGMSPLTYQILGVSFIIATYLIFSMRFWLSVAAGVSATIGYDAGSFLSAYLPTPDTAISVALQLVGNGMLIFLVYRLNLLRRMQFGYFVAEREAREKLIRRELDLMAASNNLEHARDEAEEATRAKSAFVANVSHEIRTPLNAIIGFSEVMQKRALGPADFGAYDGYLADISSSAKHLLDIINDLLDLSKVEAGKLELEDDRFAPEALVNTAITFVSEAARHAKIEVEVGDMGDRVELRGDQRILRQVIINLLSNAVKYAGARSKVSITGQARADGCYALSVADTGRGIAAEELPHIMELYGRAELAQRAGVTGTGLGLPVARMHMELHDGELLLESREGHGTTATMVLPADRVTAKSG